MLGRCGHGICFQKVGLVEDSGLTNSETREILGCDFGFWFLVVFFFLERDITQTHNRGLTPAETQLT